MGREISPRNSLLPAMPRSNTHEPLLAAYAQTRQTRRRSYEAVLDAATVILEQHRAERARRPPSFNIFYALGHAYREVATHSALLAHLLDPRGGHSQGTLFLSGFLTAVRSAALSQGLSIPIAEIRHPDNWSCQREVALPDGLGQADLVLRGPELIMVIENKIHAGEGSQQIPRYWSYAQREAGRDRTPVLVYLTPDGRPTRSDCSRFQHRLVLVSYHRDIFPFLSDAAQSLHAVSVAEVLRQYADLVRNLT